MKLLKLMLIPLLLAVLAVYSMTKGSSYLALAFCVMALIYFTVISKSNIDKSM